MAEPQGKTQAQGREKKGNIGTAHGWLVPYLNPIGP